MLRLPTFRYHRPRTAAEAVRILAESGPKARFVAGGTDLYPNMKRRHQSAEHLISLARVEELRGIDGDGPAGTCTIGAMTTLREIERDPRIGAWYPAFVQAVASVSSPLLRNMGTIGGNLLLDTRCNYYNQTEEWRASIDFCMKERGPICWVAPGSPRCYAVQSSDTVPLLCAIGAEVTLLSPGGERRVAVDDLYRDDGIAYLTKRPDELLTRVHLPASGAWSAAYHKLRRRGSIDFPVLGVGAWVARDGERIADVRVRIGGVGSMPIHATETEAMLRGQPVTEELVRAAAELSFKPARTMDNTDSEVPYRKKMAPIFVRRALSECLGL
ncbi:MAG: FAD binding domain-containing protein [Planctomycetes bacterium]|nr:FAD binding domain-containing protein [Planctomycetota bacterium]MCB9871270.1 FAD binding domain-containing protein [Planctomycetota bacterium]